MNMIGIDKISTKKKVMVVEDDKFLSNLLISKLEKEGYKIIHCVDSKEVFRELATAKPDIILLDLILPGVDGFEILTKIKSDVSYAPIPVIILSNLGQKDDVQRVMSLGAVDFLVKANFTLGEIIDKVKDVLASSPTTGS